MRIEINLTSTKNEFAWETNANLGLLDLVILALPNTIYDVKRQRRFSPKIRNKSITNIKPETAFASFEKQIKMNLDLNKSIKDHSQVL